MIAKKTDYIIIYSFLFASILCIAMMARLFVVKELQMDEFTGFIAFVVSCLLLSANYISFQSIINECLLPTIERIFQNKKATSPQSILEIKTQPIKEIQYPVNDSATQNINSTNYKDYKSTAQQKIIEEQQRTLDKVVQYTLQELSLYVEEDEMSKLCKLIQFFQYANEDECDKIQTQITISSKLKPIDLMHFGWNVGYPFNKSGIEIATFIKRIFAESLQKSEISTIKSKLRLEGTCIIKIKENL